MALSEPRFVDGRAMLLAGLREVIPLHAMHSAIPQQWVRFNEIRAGVKQKSPVTYGVSCGVSAAGCDYLCAFEVDSFDEAPADFGRVRVEPQQYAVFTHSGHISTIGQEFSEIVYQWLPSSGYQSAHKPDFELYDERYDPVTGIGDVEIWISIVL
jgi:AraC family transcriptional regulator